MKSAKREHSPSVPSVPPARQGSTPPLQREHAPSAPVPGPNPGRGTGQAKSRITLRTPSIWEDDWQYDLDHPNQTLHVPSPRPDTTKTPGRNIVLFEEPAPPEAIPGSGRPLSESPLKKILTDINARAITPRQMQDLSLELYVNGILSWEEHVELAFQPELHPDFERTIGALTGEKPLPDQPRDYVREWERRLDFERRFAPSKSRARDRALHILSVLRRIERPASLLA